MGIRDFLFPAPVWRRKAITASPEVLEAFQARGGPSFFPLIAVPNRGIQAGSAYERTVNASYGVLYQTQPSVRAVVDFMARNVAQLALRLYERTSDIERHQASDHPAAVTLRNPNPQTPGQKFIFNLVRDYLVYGNAFALKSRVSPTAPLILTQLPPWRTSVVGPSYFTADAYRIYRGDGTSFDRPPADIFHWPAATEPNDPRIGLSPLETLRSVLAEESASQAANVELLKSGLLKAGYISRPLEAPDWSPEAQERFKEDWANAVKDVTRHTPVLEEGMEVHDFGVSPKDAQQLDGRRFTIEEVCRVYGFPQGLAGIVATGASVADEREAFYADVLPPLCEMLSAYLDLSILRGEYDAPDYYFEFDLDEKLVGNARLTALTSASGGPITTRNEARAKLNLPPKEGGDELIVPLNVTVGGKPSPQVMPIQNPNAPPQDGSHRTEGPVPAGGQSATGNGKRMFTAIEGLHQGGLVLPDGSVAPGAEQAVATATVPKQAQVETKAMLLLPRLIAQNRRRDASAEEMTKALRGFYIALEKDTRSKAEGFDLNRWANKLKAILLVLLKAAMNHEAGLAAARFGLNDFPMSHVEHYLDKIAESEAASITADLSHDLAAGDPKEVFAESKDLRSPGIGMRLATRMNSQAQLEAAKLTPDFEHRTKTWVVTSNNSKHPEMNGEVRPLGERFSNGKEAPPYDHPRCQCLLSVT